MLKRMALVLILLIASLGQSAFAGPFPEVLIKKAIDLWRGNTSYMESTMVVHRPDWERKMAMKSWTRGDKDALIRFTAPSKDAGNATLKLSTAMWMFTPKLNQVIKLPASMMAQSWMGSDFSYNDLAKSDHILFDFTHQHIKTEKRDGHSFYTIESIPKPDAPVVWGKERLIIRDDYVLMEQQFFDQDMQLLKRMVAKKVALLDKRPYAVELRMENLEKPDQWTEVRTVKGQFNVSLPNYIWTQSNLRNPRQ